MADSATLYTLGFTLIFIGVLILIITAIFATTACGKKGSTKAAGIILIGPVPIIFGSDKKSVRSILALSIILTAALIVALLIYYFLFR